MENPGGNLSESIHVALKDIRKYCYGRLVADIAGGKEAEGV